jgi:prepilin-type N-terminal cleavage/methylation domain-containing protein
MKKRAGQRVSKNYKTGFTFVELLIAMVIVAIVSGAVIMLGYTYFNHFEQSTELSMARERGIMVVTYLEKRILNTGLGMPGTDDDNDFSDAFGDLWSAIAFDPYTASRDWNGPIYLPEVEEDQKHSSNELVIAYSVPAGVYATSQDYVTEGERPIEISVLSSGFKDKLSTNPNVQKETKNWVLFPSIVEYPSSRLPLLITEQFDTGDTTISLRTIKGSGKISENDELHYIRFMHAYVEKETFKVDDLTIAHNQPIVEGILSCRFTYDEPTNLLEVSILARGDKQYSSYVAPENLNGWGTVENDDWRKYHLTVVNKGWRVRN